MPSDDSPLKQAILREAIATRDSIQELKREGLLRQVDTALEPTYPALRAHELLEGSDTQGCA